jgi:hypothetical protein
MLMIKIKDMDSFKLSYMYFFPMVFFPFLNIYQFHNDADVKSWLFRNLLISITIILIPLFLTISMLITKFLYQDKDKKNEYRSVLLGLLCLIFLMGANYYQFQKFSVGTDLTIDHYRMALMVSFLIGCFISSICFTLKYQKYTKNCSIEWNTKTQRFMASAAPSVFIAITALFVI